MKPQKSLLELDKLSLILEKYSSLLEVEELARVQDRDVEFPIHKISIGNQDPSAPVVGFIGGVHGLERIGSQVVLAYMNTLLETVLWDESLQEVLKKIRVFFIPIVNPVGIYRRYRSNGNGVDLMRNAPVEAENPPFMLGGHRYSKHLPWYRGENGLETEAKVVVDAILQEIGLSKRIITLDVHSGFGLNDQLWLPMAKSMAPFEKLAETHALVSVFEKSHPNHFYKIEPQSKNYTTHGDLWDYLYELNQKNQNVYLPLCLEMGSWMWVKKNPLQIFSREGLFHPLRNHRERRVLRRHHTLFDFFLRVVNSGRIWSELSEDQRLKHDTRAKELWYGR